MTNDATPHTRGLIANLARRMLRPIIGILIRNGLHFSEFSAISRSLFVDVAGDEFGIKGRRTNTSRIALLTGLSRAQVKRELDRDDKVSLADGADSAELDEVRFASRLLLGWHTDRRFSGADGQPRPLTMGGPAGFEQLYETYSGKAVPMTSILKELINVGAIERLPDDRVVARARSYMPQQTNPAALFRVGLAVSDLAITAGHNLYPPGNAKLRFERFATNQLIPKAQIEPFQDFLAAEGQAFLERADDWLSAKEVSDSQEVVRIGVGIYQILTPPIKTKK